MTNQKIRDIRKLISFRSILVFFSLIAAWPCVFFLMGYIPNYKINIIGLLICSVIYILLNKKEISPLPNRLVSIIFVQLSTWVLYTMIHVDLSYVTRVIFILTSTFVIIIDNKNNNQLFIRIFIYWISLQSFLSALGFILCFGDLLQPLSTFEEMDGREGYNFGICTSNVYIGQFIRPAGFFDEPGALACWGIHALVLNKLFLNNKRIEYCLLICLITTLSLAFFIQSFLYLVLFYRKHLKYIVLASMVFVAILSVLISQDPQFEKNTIGRLQYDKEEGSFSGDNRSDYRVNAQKVFYSSPFIGVGATNLVNNYEDINSNEYTFLASDGIIGVLITWIPYVYLFVLGRKRKELRYAVIVLFVGLFQRPFDFNQLLYTLMVYSLIKHALIKHPIIDNYYCKK